jgi:hypothetical protein
LDFLIHEPVDLGKSSLGWIWHSLTLVQVTTPTAKL